MLKGIAHFKAKGLSFQHMQIVLAVDMFSRLTHGKEYPRASDIADLLSLPEDKIQKDILKLVVDKYLHEMHSTYGELVMRYKLGTVGGTSIRKILSAGKLRAEFDLTD